MRKILAFIFDLDGVITDTSEFHYQAWQHLANDEGIPFSREENERLRGVGRPESLAIMLKGRVISEATAKAWMDRKNDYYVELVHTVTPKNILPGVIGFLNEIIAAGMLTALASASKNAPLVIEKLSLRPYFQVVVDGLTVTRSKPAPDLFLKAAELLNVAPGSCVVVEDATSGVEAGQAAGMLTLGLGPLERVGMADLALPDLSHASLQEVLAGLNKE